MTTRSMIRRLFQYSIVPLGVALVSVATMQPASQAQPPANGDSAAANADQQPGTTVLTRGPIHEAFGQPTIFNPKPGLQIPKKPPQPVEELPPDEKPEGDNVAWIGGYWSWDEDKSDFMWISGFWRVMPPSRQWMPGYWNEAGGQFQWVSGYWANAKMQEQELIQQAPLDSLEQGAPPTAPSQDHIWAPGTWVYRDSRYLWRPGYWVVNQPGWAWVPATYIWTPSGYIFVDGYWDWSIRRRGVIFAPCYFDYAVCYRPGFYYRPSVCLDVEVITPHFFCRPAYGHYYFGDYYATSYLSVGITPWFNFTYARGSRFYSSDFAYYECHYRRTNPSWSVQIRVGYESCRDNVAIRPARTFVAQQTIINKTTIVNNNTTIINNNNMALAKPMKSYTATMAKNADAPMKFEKINDAKARDFGKTATEIRKVGAERVAMEKPGLNAPGKTGSTAGTNTAVRRMTMPKSPVVSKISADTGSDNNSKNVKVGNIGGGSITRTPPPVPGSSGIKSNPTGNLGSAGTGTPRKTGVGSSDKPTGGTGAGSAVGSTGTGSGTSTPSKMDPTKTGQASTGGAGTTGSSTRIPPVNTDPPGKSTIDPSGKGGGSSGTGTKSSGSSVLPGTKSSGSGTGTKNPGSGTGTKSSGGSSKSGSSSSGSSKEKGKDKP